MIRGSCLCQGVAFEVHGQVVDLLYCHCAMCRKAHGSAFRARGKVLASEFKWLRGEERVRYHESSPGQHRGFCSTCGSNLITRFTENPKVLGLALGVLDDDPVHRPLCHVHVASKAPWHEITDTLPQFDTLPTGPVPSPGSEGAPPFAPTSMNPAAEAPTGVVAIRPAQEVMTLQRLPYFVGISGSTIGSRGLSMHLVVIPPGAKADPHIHIGYETGIYVLEGRVLTRWGHRLENETISEAGEFLFVPAGVPHEAENLSATTPARAVVARNDPAEQDRVVPYRPPAA